MTDTNPTVAIDRYRSRKAQWELFWMVFYDQSRLDTFRKIVALGFDRRSAAELVQSAEREG